MIEAYSKQDGEPSPVLGALSAIPGLPKLGNARKIFQVGAKVLACSVNAAVSFFAARQSGEDWISSGISAATAFASTFVSASVPSNLITGSHGIKVSGNAVISGMIGTAAEFVSTTVKTIRNNHVKKFTRASAIKKYRLTAY